MAFRKMIQIRYPPRLWALLASNILGAEVETIVVDSPTAIITPLAVQARTQRGQLAE